MNKHYHFIGIGGIGMSALAGLLLDKGYQVSGSDLQANKNTENLQKKGASIYLNHSSDNMSGADCIIFSSAISEDNPEYSEAKRKEIPLMQRAKLLAELMEEHVGITVAGAHGKTTTSSMIAHLLTKAKFQPTTAVGGIVSDTHSHGRLGTGDYFVTEVDESDGSFLYFSPFFSVITNIDFEHIDYYPDWPSVLNAYKTFISKTDKIGTTICFGDDYRLLELVKSSKQKFKTYGFLPHNHCRAINIQYDYFSTQFDCVIKGQNFGQINLKVIGRHNVANALACISLGMSLALDFDLIRDSLKDYNGVQRRFQLKDTIDDVWIIDDYAHHPTEIKAVLETAQEFKRSLPGQGNKLVTILQPHRYSRVNGLMDEYIKCLTNSDELIITDIYAAGEEPIKGVSARILVNRIRKITDKPIRYLPKNKIVKYLRDSVKPHDVILTLGAGDITRLADDLAFTLKAVSPAVTEI